REEHVRRELARDGDAQPDHLEDPEGDAEAISRRSDPRVLGGPVDGVLEGGNLLWGVTNQVNRIRGDRRLRVEGIPDPVHVHGEVAEWMESRGKLRGRAGQGL